MKSVACCTGVLKVLGEEDKAAGVTATLAKKDELVLVTIRSQKNRTVNWRVK